MRRKRWLWKAWIEAFATTWLQWSSPLEHWGGSVYCIVKEHVCGSPCSSLEYFTRVILLSNAFQLPSHSHEGWRQIHHSDCWATFCEAMHTADSPGILKTGQPTAALGLDLCRRPRRGRFNSPNMIWHGSETLNLWGLFIGDYRCVSGFSIFYAEI